MPKHMLRNRLQPTKNSALGVFGPCFPSVLITPMSNPEQPALADVSIEVGHFYEDTLSRGAGVLQKHFAEIRDTTQLAIQSWSIRQAQESAGAKTDKPQVTTCFMFDDYHNQPTATIRPAESLELVFDAAANAGIQIDYLAREAAYVPMARAAFKLLERSENFRLTAAGSGWLIAEQPDLWPAPAMRPDPYLTHNQIKIDVELYNNAPESKGQKPWACPFLASMWQIHRLGGLANLPAPEPTLVTGQLPDWERWEDVPPVIQRTANAPPFAARQAYSVLPADFSPVESAVGQIIHAIGVAAADPAARAKRIGYYFNHFADEDSAAD
jgi:hypothetical protein